MTDARSSAEVRRAYAANIWKVYLLHFLLYFQLWWSVWVLYLRDLRGFSLTQITVLDALFWGAAILAEVPTGAIADRFGRKTSLALGAGATTLAVLIFGLATNYWVVLASYAAWAVGLAFLSGAEHALLFESLKQLGREGDFQRVAGRLLAVFSFATLAGTLAGAPIAAVTDLSVPVLLSAAIAAPGVLVALSLREPPLAEGGRRLAYGSLLRESARTALRTPSIRTMLVLSSLVSAFVIGPQLFMQPFLAEHGVDTGLLGVFQTPVRVLALVGALVAYRFVAWTGMRGAFLSVSALAALAYLWLGAWDTLHAFAAFPLAALFNSLLVPAATDYLNLRIPDTLRATVLSLRTMLISLWLALLEPGLGVVADLVSLRAVFLTTAALAAVALPTALALWLRADAAEAPQGAPQQAPTPGA